VQASDVFLTLYPHSCWTMLYCLFTTFCSTWNVHSRLSWVVGPDGLEQLCGKSPRDMLLAIGKDTPWLRRTLDSTWPFYIFRYKFRYIFQEMITKFISECACELINMECVEFKKRAIGSGCACSPRCKRGRPHGTECLSSSAMPSPRPGPTWSPTPTYAPLFYDF
jgi:hypothetical protein